VSSLSVIIATMDREEELYRCLDSIRAQSRLPEELVIVDDGALDVEALRLRVPQGVEFQYHRKSPPGLSASRNLGARAARGEFLLFLDDDVVLEPNFIEEISKIFQEDRAGTLGGVSGVIVNRRPRPRWFRAWAKIFFLDRGRPGELFPWGFFSEIGIPDRVVDVDWIPGGLSCFRKSVFQELGLSDMNQKGRHGLADIEFSWRVSRKYEFKVTPFARLAHYPKGRDPNNALDRGRRQLLNHGRIFRTHGSPTAANWLKFLWASFGLVSGNMGAAVLARDGRERRWRALLGLGNLLGSIEFLCAVRTGEDSL
jgi:GT2 family glycosyltransferase